VPVSPAALIGTMRTEPHPPLERRPGRAPLGLVAAPGLLACLLGPAGAACDVDARPPSPEEAVTTAGAPDSLRLRLELPDEVEAGAPVPITLVAKNVTDRALELYLTGRPVAFDLTVIDEAGAVVWRRLEGQMILMVLRIETLAPGAALELHDTWDQRTNEGVRVPPGAYTVRGEILAEGERLPTPPRELRILP
jgi:hypothetical protein